MERGQIVNVYEDPGTCKKLEGKAKLLKCLGEAGVLDEHQLESWWVKFLDDGFETNRLINPKH